MVAPRTQTAPISGRFPAPPPGFPLKTGGNDKGETGGNDKGETGGNDKGETGGNDKREAGGNDRREQAGMTTRNLLPEACFSQFVGLGFAFRAEHGGKFSFGSWKPFPVPSPLEGEGQGGGCLSLSFREAQRRLP